jgi:Flp pilus assembly protein CpaB
MAEEPRVNNTKLLLISVVLGLVVMALYNYHVEQVRSAARGESVTVYRLARDAKANEELEMSDLKQVSIPKPVFDSLGNPIKASDIDSVIGVTRLYKPVLKGDYLTWDHFSASGESSPAEKIEVGTRGVIIEFDPRRSPGGVLNQGDYIDVLGYVRPPGKDVTRTYNILPAVKVIEVPGADPSSRERRGSPTRYRRVMVQVSPEVSQQFKDIVSWVEGSLWIDVRSSTEALPDRAGKIDRELEGLPANVGRRPGGSFDGFE